MKKVNLREWKDLSPREKEQATAHLIEDIVEGDMEGLCLGVQSGNITESEYYEALGCSKLYAETTAWFVPSCYYEKNKPRIDKEVKKELAHSVFDLFGHPVYFSLSK